MSGQLNMPGFPTVVLIVTALAAILLIYVFGWLAVLHALGWASVGVLIGWLASLIKRTPTQRAILIDFLIGAVGAVFGVLLFGGGSVYEGGPLERILSAIVGSAFVLFIAALVDGYFSHQDISAA